MDVKAATGTPIPFRTQMLVYLVACFTGSQVLIVSVVIPLWALALGASPVMIGVVIAARQVLVIMFAVHGGALQDRYGPRAVIMVMGTAGACVFMLYPLFPVVWATIALQMVSGFLEVTGWIGAQALVGGLLRGEATYTGRMTAAARIGGFASPILAGLAWQHLGTPLAFFAVSGWVLMGSVMAYFLPDTRPAAEQKPEKRAAADAAAAKVQRPAGAETSPRGFLPNLSDYVTTFRLLTLAPVALVICCTFMRQAGSGIQNSFYGVWLNEHGTTATTIGLLLGLSNAVSAVAALTVGWTAARVRGHWLLIGMTIMAVVAIAITPMLGGFFALAFFMGLRGWGQGYNFPLMLTISSQAVGPHLQGRVAALRISFNKFGGTLVPIIMGAIAEFVGLRYAFFLVGAVGVVALAGLGVWAARSPAFRDEPGADVGPAGQSARSGAIR